MGKSLFRSNASLFARIQNAVEVLTIDEGDARSRLKNAYWWICPILVGDLPEKFRDDWIKYNKAITRFSPRGGQFAEDENQWNLSVTLKRIKNKTAAKMSQLIFDIFVYLIHEEE